MRSQGKLIVAESHTIVFQLDEMTFGEIMRKQCRRITPQDCYIKSESNGVGYTTCYTTDDVQFPQSLESK